jgi:hypothetical protein
VASPLLDTTVLTEQLREIQERCIGNAPLLRVELSKLRIEYVVMRIAAKLAERSDNGGSSDVDLRGAANRILAKAGSKAVSVPIDERRTEDEERLVGAAKVGWHKLLKAQGLAPARPWTRASTRPAKLRGLHRQIPKVQHNREQVRDAIQRYIAKQALHLLNACEEARTLDERAISPRIEQAIANLYSICIGADSPSLDHFPE